MFGIFLNFVAQTGLRLQIQYLQCSNKSKIHYFTWKYEICNKFSFTTTMLPFLEYLIYLPCSTLMSIIKLQAPNTFAHILQATSYKLHAHIMLLSQYVRKCEKVENGKSRCYCKTSQAMHKSAKQVAH